MVGHSPKDVETYFGDTDSPLLPGEGSFDWAGLAKLWAATGYVGPIILEVARQGIELSGTLQGPSAQTTPAWPLAISAIGQKNTALDQRAN